MHSRSERVLLLAWAALIAAAAMGAAGVTLYDVLRNIASAL